MVLIIKNVLLWSRLITPLTARTLKKPQCCLLIVIVELVKIACGLTRRLLMLLLQHTYMYYKMTSNKKNEYSKLGFSPRFFLSIEALIGMF